MNIRPCGCMLLVRREKPVGDQRLEALGLATPETAQKPVTRGVVLAKGPGRWTDEGHYLTPARAQVDDRIVWDREGAHEVPWDKELVLVSDEYVLGILEEDATP